MGPAPFRVRHSEHARELFASVLQQAVAAGRQIEAIAAARAIEQGLLWFADEFGEFRQPLHRLGELRYAVILPIAVVFAVHAGRREVQVGRYRFVDRPRRG